LPTVTPRYDIQIRNAALRNQTGRFEIGIAKGRIAGIAEDLGGSASTEIDAGGNLVTESFVNPHLHLCKVWTLQMMDEAALRDYQERDMGSALTAVELAARIKERYAESWILENARRAVALAAINGTLHIRAMADVDTQARLEGLKALLRLRDEFKGIVDLQVVAFACGGIVRDQGTADLLRQGMELGADVVGGIPWIEFTDEAAAEHIKVCFDLAEAFDKDVSMLLDDAGDPGLRTLEMMAVEAIRRGWEGRALAHHCRAMSMYPQPYFQRLARTLQHARVPIVSDPQTGPLHARVKELLSEKILVCLGQDDISDAFYTFGRNNMLEVAFLAAHLLWMMTERELDALYDMVTISAAKAMNVAPFQLEVGAPAHLVVLDQPNVVEVLRFHREPVHVISHGKLVDLEAMKRLAQAPLALPDGKG
jgi:cytosine deaminase